MNLCVIVICGVISLIRTDKIDDAVLKDYGGFFNFGDKKVKLDERKPQLKPKLEVLGAVFKENIDSIKSSNKKLDFVFLIDSSSSIGEKNFQNEIKFVRKLLSDVVVDYNHARVAIVTFSSAKNVIRNIDEISNPKEENNKCLLLNKELTHIKYSGGGTYTLGAFEIAHKIFEKAREDSRKVLFLITDGYSNGGDPVPIAVKLKKQNVTIFTIGIKSGNYKELYELSSSPGEHFSYLLDSFDEFEGLARRALHADLQTGDYITLVSKYCDGLCENGNCCDSKARCTCGTSTGHYSCICPAGYYGSGLNNSCSPCPAGSYGSGTNLCLPCPDIHHITPIMPAVGIESCQCKPGYHQNKDVRCEVIKCVKLSPPKHGYFVKNKDCGNVLNSACGVRCEVGYTMEGSSIRLCQSNTSWSGQNPSCQIKTCDALSVPAHGSIVCRHYDLDKLYSTEKELPVDTVCSFGCERGRTLVGSRQRTCLPLAQWDGLRTLCKQIKCNKLPKLQYGQIEPASCTIGKQAFGKVCKFTCNKGFELSGSPEKMCMRLHGLWLPEGETRCKDITKPVIRCPENVKGTTLPGKNFGRVYWPPPLVKDNSGLNVTTWTKPSMRDGKTFKFRIGTTNVTYFAQDAYKNQAKCHFIVEISDNEAPTIEGCVDPPPYLTTDRLGANITWDEPDIFDNSQIVQIDKSQEFGFFKIGVTSVVYTAKDLANNTNICILNITVEESQCVPLPDPIYGQSDCKSSDEGLQCIITCQEGYALPITYLPNTIDVDNSSTQFLCNNDDPIWYSYDRQIFPECSVTELPVEILDKALLSIENENASIICNDRGEMKKFNNNIKQNIKTYLEGTCNDIICNVTTQIECEDQAESEQEEKTNIIKRDIPTRKPTRKLKKLRKRKKLKLKLQVNAKNKRGGNKQLSKVRNHVMNIQSLDGINITSVHMGKPKITCPTGCIAKKLKCVHCPAGTFHNTERNICQSCPIGSYNNKTGQTNCQSCPKNYSTRKLHAKNIKDCVEECPPGTYARKKKVRAPKNHPNAVIERITLTPFCRSCPIGEFQPEFGELFCIPCPPGYTTDTAKSIAYHQCVPTVHEVCSNTTGICNNGLCIIENDFYYSCSCSNEYIGSHCETKINFCLHQPCQNQGTCVPKENDDYICICQKQFAGRNCEILQEKCSLICMNGGRCIQNEDEEFCLCPQGFGGETCEIIHQYCRPGICENGGKCVESYDGFHCECQNGYLGRRCNILPCDYQPCPPNSFCINTGAVNATRTNFRCDCFTGYFGKDCTIKIDHCKNNLCRNKAVCENSDITYTCKCTANFFGQFCENKVNTNYALNFPKAGVSDFIRLEGFKNNLPEISVCLWMSTIDNFNYGTLLSYATSEYDNTFTITDYGGLVFYINSKNRITDIQLNDGFWHYFCWTWENKFGTYIIYVDGKIIFKGSEFAAGELIQGGGKMIIGQEQDVLGGRFSQAEAFKGKIAYFNVWGKVLTVTEILHLMETCEDEDYGDLYAWPEIQYYINGDVKIENSTFCQICPDPGKLYQGLIEILNNVAYYTCNKGYYLTIPVYGTGRKCTKASKWEGKIDPQCKAVHCGYPGYFRHGNIIGRKYYYRDRVTYQCSDEYKLVGTSTRVCTENGTWQPTAPKCVGIQCKAFKIPTNSKLIVTSDYSDEYLDGVQNFEVGTSIEIACTENAKLNGENVLTCESNGEWDFPVPECVLEKTTSPGLSCSLDHIPSAPTNGYIVQESINTVKNGTANTIEYKCRVGYRLRGENYTTCILDGYWTQPNISCDHIKCGKPPRIKNMKVTAELLNKDYFSGHMLTLECVEGYRIIGNPIIRCTATGRWSRIQAKCNRQSCGKPAISEATIIEGDSYLYQDSVTLICENNKRYTLVCGSTGAWLGEKGDSC